MFCLYRQTCRSRGGSMAALTLRFRRSRPVARTLLVTQGGSAMIAALAVVVSLVSGRPVPHLGVLMVVWIPLLIVGQVWTILRMWEKGLTRRALPQRWLLMPWSGNPIQFFFGSDRAGIGRLLVAVAIGGWLALFTVFPALRYGEPYGHSDGCPYQLAQHGRVTCVTRAAYERAGAAVQRGTAGLLLPFFCVHVGAALGALAATSPVRRHRK
jgi:hypothetical protein